MDNDRIVEIGARAVDPNAWVVTREDRVTWLSNIPDERILASKHSRRQKARWSTRKALAAFEEAGLVVVSVSDLRALVNAPDPGEAAFESYSAWCDYHDALRTIEAFLSAPPAAKADPQ